MFRAYQLDTNSQNLKIANFSHNFWKKKTLDFSPIHRKSQFQ